MNDEEIIKFLELTMQSSVESELTNEAVDAILLEAKECPDERTDRVRRRYIEKLFEELYPSPVQKIENKFTFGRWIESARNKVKLAPADVASSLGQEPVFLERIERGEIPPWECKPEFVADLMSLFRIHVEAVTQLVSSSAAVSQVRGVGRVAARSRGGKVSKERGDSTARALELFLAHNASPAALQDEVTEWVESLRGTLKSSNLNHLID